MSALLVSQLFSMPLPCAFLNMRPAMGFEYTAMFCSGELAYMAFSIFLWDVLVVVTTATVSAGCLLSLSRLFCVPTRYV